MSLVVSRVMNTLGVIQYIKRRDESPNNVLLITECNSELLIYVQENKTVQRLRPNMVAIRVRNMLVGTIC